MEVRMEHTQGYGRQAEVWVDGELLCVCDNISTDDRRCAPGILDNVRFLYHSDTGTPWSDARQQNPGRKQLLEPIKRWSYTGYGRVLQIQPVVVDFGLLVMEDNSWTTDESLIGKYVAVQIDRLEIAHPKSEFPPELR